MAIKNTNTIENWNRFKTILITEGSIKNLTKEQIKMYESLEELCEKHSHPLFIPVYWFEILDDPKQKEYLTEVLYRRVSFAIIDLHTNSSKQTLRQIWNIMRLKKPVVYLVQQKTNVPNGESLIREEFPFGAYLDPLRNTQLILTDENLTQSAIINYPHTMAVLPYRTPDECISDFTYFCQQNFCKNKKSKI